MEQCQEQWENNRFIVSRQVACRKPLVSVIKANLKKKPMKILLNFTVLTCIKFYRTKTVNDLKFFQGIYAPGVGVPGLSVEGVR